MDPARHEDWATEIPDGYERGEHNRGGTRWTAHALGHDDEFLAATARHPDEHWPDYMQCSMHLAEDLAFS